MAVPVPEEGTSDHLFAALEEMVEATRAAHEALRLSEERTRQYIERLRAGERTIDIARAVPGSYARYEINGVMERLTAARQRARSASFRQLIVEGMSRKEIAANWGFSLQVVSKVLNYQDPSEPGTGRQPAPGDDESG
jgi:DNA invertase Pin-like site-specific DNA recombinase